MKICFIFDTFRRRSKMLLDACLKAYKDNNADFWIFLQNGFCETSAENIHILHENRFDVILDNVNYIRPDVIIYSSWVGGSIELLQKLKAYNHKIISDFQDCADGLEFLSENSSRICQMTETMEISDGILIRDPRWFESKISAEILKRKKYISYPDYLFKRAKALPFSDPQKDKSVIFLGSLGIGKLEDEIGWYKTIEAFLRQGFLVKAVPSPGHILHNIQSKYWRLACRNPQFELLESLPMNKLGLIVRACGFGININQKSIFHCQTNLVSINYLNNCSSSRMYDYAEEGLGTIISPDLKYVKKTWDRSGACITCGAHEISSLAETIKNKRSEFSKYKYKNWENENLLENNLSALRNFISIIKTVNKSRRIQKGIHSSDINFFDKKIYHLQQRLAAIEGTLVHAREKNLTVAKKIKRYFIKKSTSVYKRLFAKHYKKRK
jgi:hypothetical protein